MNKFIPIAFVCLALFAAAQGATLGQIEDVAFELEGQQYHLTPLERRVRHENHADPDPSGGGHQNQNCKVIDLPATLQLKVCGCSNPGCPSCPCNTGADINEDTQDKNNNKNNNATANNANKSNNANNNNNNNANNNKNNANNNANNNNANNNNANNNNANNNNANNNNNNKINITNNNKQVKKTTSSPFQNNNNNNNNNNNKNKGPVSTSEKLYKNPRVTYPRWNK